MEMNNVYVLPIGDGSKTSSLMSIDFMFKTNVTSEQIIQSYNLSCQRTGVQFHSSVDRSGLPTSWDNTGRPTYPMYEEPQDIVVFHDEGDDMINFEAFDRFEELGYMEFVRNSGLFRDNFMETIDDPFEPEELFHTLMWFISLSLPNDFSYEVVPMPIVLADKNIGMGLFDW